MVIPNNLQDYYQHGEKQVVIVAITHTAPMVKPKKAPATECCTLSVALDITVVTGRKSGSAPRSLEASKNNRKPSQTHLDAQQTAPIRAGTSCTIPHSQKYQFQHPHSSLGETVIFFFSGKDEI
jgi:hypothetical protein